MNSFSNKTSSNMNVGIIGCGKMGKHHLKAVKFQKNATIAAVADPSIDEIEFGDLIDVNTIKFKSPEDLLSSGICNIVHIVTPPHTHYDIAVMALEHGCHIYIEKPFTEQRVEAEKIFSLAKQKGLKVCAGHQVLFESPAEKAKRALSIIGKIVHIESYFSFRTVRKNITTVDQIIDILPHPTSLLLSFLEYASTYPIELDTLLVNPKGEIRAIFISGEIYGSLNVTLQGRPIESFIRIVGSNGSLYADFVRGILIETPGPGASAISVIYNAYSRALQGLIKSTLFFSGMLFKTHKSYPGLSEIINNFYYSIRNNTEFNISNSSVLKTVTFCEQFSKSLFLSETKLEEYHRKHLKTEANKLKPLANDSPVVLVTGGTGFLGRVVSKELRKNGHYVRILTRHVPPFSKQLPGVEYAQADISETISKEIMSDVAVIVHCAAETSGGFKQHEKNTIRATQLVMETAAASNVKRVINISSIAILKPTHSSTNFLQEDSPVDIDNLSRGPYVWGKAKAETIAFKIGNYSGITVKSIRLGPLVDFSSFNPPGRLGKEIGPLFVAVGSKHSTISVCDIRTAADIIRLFVEDFENSPKILNLVEAPSIKRSVFTTKLKEHRKDLKILWLPFFILNIFSPLLIILQRALFPGKEPIDISAIFSSEPYNTVLAEKIIKRAKNR